MAIPDWIRERKEQKDKYEALRSAAEQRQRADSLLTQRDGPLFWDRLVKELKNQLDALSLIDMSGTMSVSGEIKTEIRCAIKVVPKNQLQPSASLTIFYSAADCREIRVENEPPIGLAVYGENVIMAIDDDLKPAKPEDVAESLVKKLADKLNTN